MTLMRYTTADFPTLFKKISENSIGMEEYIDKLFNTQEHNSPNYPPYNILQLSNSELKLEIALAGFKSNEVSVYTKDGKLYVEGKKEPKETKEGEYYVHKGLAHRGFTRFWSLSEDTEVKSVKFEDGLLEVLLGRIIPEHHKRKDYL